MTARMHVGQELERSRQRRGLSLEEVARRTKISVERLDAIERQDVHLLPPPVYVRGFVRAYATEVGLDPDDVASRYLAQFDECAPLAEFDSEQPAVAAPPDNDRITRPLPPASPEEAAPPWRPAQFVPPQPRRREAAAMASSGRILQIMDDPGDLPPLIPSRRRVAVRKPRSPWRFRFTAAAVAAASVIAGFALSANLHRLRAVYEGPQPVAASASDLEATPTQPQGQVAHAVAESRDPPRAAAERTANASPVDDLTGAWSLTTRVESTTVDVFRGLALGYRVQLEQRGNRVTGAGYKATENGRSIVSGSRTPIKVEGTLNGRRLELAFTETGARRTSGGTFVMDVADDGSMRGSFSSDAAESRGSAHATRSPR